MLTSRLYGGRSVTSSPPRCTRPAVGSSKPPIIRSVVVLPQPDGPSRAKKRPASISRSSASTAVTSPKRLVSPSSADVGAHARVLRSCRCAPVEHLLGQVEVDEGLGVAHGLERADAVDQVQQVAAVAGDHLDEQVEAAGHDDDVDRLVPAGQLVGDLLRRPVDARGRASPSASKPSAERVGDRRDLQHVGVDQPPVAVADRRLGDAEPRSASAGTALAAVVLQRLDELRVEVVERRRAATGPRSLNGAPTPPPGRCRGCRPSRRTAPARRSAAARAG